MYSAVLERKKTARQLEDMTSDRQVEDMTIDRQVEDMTIDWQVEDMTIDRLNMDVLHEISSYISINDTYNFVKAASWRLPDLWALIKIKKANVDYYNCGECLTCLYRAHRVYKEFVITVMLILYPVTIPHNNTIWSH